MAIYERLPEPTLLEKGVLQDYIYQLIRDVQFNFENSDRELEQHRDAEEGTLGSYVQAKYTGANATFEFGDEVGGADLSPSSVNGSSGTTTSLDGTWQCMGYCKADGVTTDLEETTLWVRVA